MSDGADSDAEDILAALTREPCPLSASAADEERGSATTTGELRGGGAFGASAETVDTVRCFPTSEAKPSPKGSFRPTYGTTRAVTPAVTQAVWAASSSKRRRPSKQELQDCAQEAGWDTRHALVRDDTNLLFPIRQREMFSHPKPYYVHHGPQGDKALLIKTNIAADASPPSPALRGRHTFSGTMIDRDGNHRQWNERHSTGCLFGDKMYIAHRPTFGLGPSIFETAPSQSWRRHGDYEVAPGHWRPAAMRRPVQFPPAQV
eukprot:TRINITY_DN6650_c0_g1_i2.p2 TRINITY_DN6650_c0_g1~~TRINITY_DN6650_c0_g1_i2.p2  ORF type:complete len:261 (-),score=47.56 TRINITY_DN6650_c0_g1_i2:126-908(-)